MVVTYRAVSVIYRWTSILSLSLLMPLEGRQMHSEDTKGAIAHQQKLLAQADIEQKSALLEQLALLYLKDQDQERAFAAFLQSLGYISPQQLAKQPENATSAYERALAIYLEAHGEATTQSAKKIIDEFGPIVQEQAAPQPLGFLVAIAYANLFRYEEFCNFFYRTYVAFPEHYLAYKTKAILHVKLMERKNSEAERKIQRAAVLSNLEQAQERQPNDTTLYKLLISFSSLEERGVQVQRCINAILSQNVQIPRTDLMFYVQEAVDIKAYALAQQFVDRAHQWYPNSRIVESAQSFLKASLSPDLPR